MRSNLVVVRHTRRRRNAILVVVAAVVLVAAVVAYLQVRPADEVALVWAHGPDGPSLVRSEQATVEVAITNTGALRVRIPPAASSTASPGRSCAAAWARGTRPSWS